MLHLPACAECVRVRVQAHAVQSPGVRTSWRTHTLAQVLLFPRLSQRLSCCPGEAILGLQVWRIATSPFVERGILGVLIGCFVFWNMGAQYERKYGTIAFFYLFMAINVCANLLFSAAALFFAPVLPDLHLLSPFNCANGMWGSVLALLVVQTQVPPPSPPLPSVCSKTRARTQQMRTTRFATCTTARLTRTRTRTHTHAHARTRTHTPAALESALHVILGPVQHTNQALPLVPTLPLCALGRVCHGQSVCGAHW